MDKDSVMQKKKIFLSSPTMHGEERKFVEEAFDTNWVARWAPMSILLKRKWRSTQAADMRRRSAPEQRQSIWRCADRDTAGGCGIFFRPHLFCHL